MTAFALIPIALAFTWLALERGAAWLRWRWPRVFSAAVASNNFYGATALAVFYPILVWSFWITRQDKRIRAPRDRHPGAGLWADGLLAGAIVLQGDRGEHEVRFRARHHLVHLGGGGGGSGVRPRLRQAWRAARQERTWAVFAAGCAVFFSLNVLGNYYFNFRVTGEPTPAGPGARLGSASCWRAVVLRWMWNHPGIGAARAPPWPSCSRPSAPPAATFGTPGTCSRSGRITRTASNTA